MKERKNLMKIVNYFSKNINDMIPEVDKEVSRLTGFLEKNKIDLIVAKNSEEDLYQKKFQKIKNMIELNLDYLTTPYTEKQFYRLLFYWEKIDSESAKDYKNFFKELYD